MANNNLIINPGAPVKSSIPLVEKKFGQGFGFNKPTALNNEEDSKDILIDLSRNAKQRSAQATDSGRLDKASASPLTQALDALGEIGKRIGALQDKYAQAAGGSALSESLSSELNALAKEFKRITDSDLFKPYGSSENGQSSSTDPGSLNFTDSILKSTLNSSDEDRIKTLTDGLKGLSSISFDEILTDKTISKSIQDFIREIKGALSPQEEKAAAQQYAGEEKKSVVITAPQASIKTIGQAEGLTVSLLSYSNEDLIKAAATHTNIDQTNVLILTFNAPEPETEEERLEREKSEEQQKIVLENPGTLSENN